MKTKVLDHDVLHLLTVHVS